MWEKKSHLIKQVPFRFDEMHNVQKMCQTEFPKLQPIPVIEVFYLMWYDTTIRKKIVILLPSVLKLFIFPQTTVLYKSSSSL